MENISNNRHGLRNTGVLCYMNASISCMLNNPYVITFVLENYNIMQNEEESMCRRLSSMIRMNNGEQHMRRSVITVFNPRGYDDLRNELANAFNRYMINRRAGRNIQNNFNIREQQDAAEMLLPLIEEISNISNRREIMREPQIFRIQMRYTTVCHNAGCGTTRDESHEMINLAIDRRHIHSLEEALELYFHADILTREEENQLNCETCNIYTDATRRLQITSFPSTLTMYLVRFGNDLLKNSKHITIPLNLDLTNFKLGRTEDEHYNYKLQSVVIHIGTSINAGHYKSKPLNIYFKVEIKSNI